MQSNSSSDEPIVSINVTPLVDVGLVLVIIFMITMPFLVEKSMKIKPSDAKVVQVSSAADPILVEISEKGLLVDGRKVEMADLATALKKTMADRNVSAVSISAGKDVLHGEVINVLDAVTAAGTKELNLMDPEEGKSVSL